MASQAAQKPERIIENADPRSHGRAGYPKTNSSPLAIDLLEVPGEKAQSARDVAATAVARSITGKPRGPASTGVTESKSVVPTKGVMRANKTEALEPINLQITARAPGGNLRKVEHPSGRTRAARWIGAKKRKSRG
jgi:hypothetical protein